MIEKFPKKHYTWLLLPEIVTSDVRTKVAMRNGRIQQWKKIDSGKISVQNYRIVR